MDETLEMQVARMKDPRNAGSWTEANALFMTCLTENRRDLAQEVFDLLSDWCGEAETDHGLNSFEALARHNL